VSTIVMKLILFNQKFISSSLLLSFVITF